MSLNIQLSEMRLDDLAAEFADSLKIRITGFLADDSAAELSSACGQLPNFHVAMANQGRPALLSEREWAAMEAPRRTQLLQLIYSQAAQGQGYFYRRYKPAENCKIYRCVTDWLNSELMLGFVKSVTGQKDLHRASVQFTRYLPGDFLTRHRDMVDAEKRRFAFVLNLAPHWHPDWGGLLQFYTDQGTPAGAWTPEYNSFGIFDVVHIHSVSSIAAFAPSPRVTLSGWYHSS